MQFVEKASRLIRFVSAVSSSIAVSFVSIFEFMRALRENEKIERDEKEHLAQEATVRLVCAGERIFRYIGSSNNDFTSVLAAYSRVP